MKTALITGASRGLGKEWVLQLSEREDWTVLAACRGTPPTDLPKGVTPVALDVADERSVASLVALLEGKALDLLVNNAAVRPDPDLLLDEIDYEAMSHALVTNSVGPCRVLVAVLPALARAEAFTVVNVSSTLGSIAAVKDTREKFPIFKGTDLIYRSTKAAMNMATACTALELAERYPKSIVVALSPGWAQTDMGSRNGRDNPPLTAQDSVKMQLAVFDNLTPADSGKFLELDGTELEW